jgi:DnaJ-class molecular chaperone
MGKIYCPPCRGRGYVTFDVINLFSIVRLSRTEQCDACDGRGWIYG